MSDKADAPAGDAAETRESHEPRPESRADSHVESHPDSVGVADVGTMADTIPDVDTLNSVQAAHDWIERNKDAGRVATAIDRIGDQSDLMIADVLEVCGILLGQSFANTPEPIRLQFVQGVAARAYRVAQTLANQALQAKLAKLTPDELQAAIAGLQAMPPGTFGVLTPDEAVAEALMPGSMGVRTPAEAIAIALARA